MSQTTSFDKLPFELYGDIIQYLDKESTKSLRLAYPTPTILATTGPALFNTLVLRLGNHRHSQKILERLLSCLISPNSDELTTSNRILANVRTLVVDTRYPFVVNDDFIDARHGGSYSDHMLVDFAENVPAGETKYFLNFFKGVFSVVSGQLKSLKWQTSDFLKITTYKDIAEFLCSTATAERNFEFTVSHTFCKPSALPEYLQPLSHCDRLDIIGQYFPSDIEIDDTGMTAIADLIQRCNLLKAFSYTYEAWMDDSTLDILWEAINKVETLEELKVQTTEIIVGSVKPNPSSKKLKNLSFLCFNYLYDHSPEERDPIVNFCDSSPAIPGLQNLKKFAVGMYTEHTQKLLRQQTALTDLRLHAPSKEHFLGLWALVIPAVSKTLRRFRLTGCTGEQAWAWSQSANYARSLLKCKKLEEVEVPFIERWQISDYSVLNSLPTLINEFVQNCPNLFRIYTGDIVADYFVSQSLISSMREFESTDEFFKGRDLEVVLQRYTGGDWWRSRGPVTFPFNWDDVDMVEIFDYLVHTWKLKEEVGTTEDEKVYKFQRMQDRCRLRNECWEDD